MADYLFPVLPQPAAAIRGSSLLYPVRRMFFVGRNYESHATEMGVKPDKEEPFYFTKTPSAVVASGTAIAYPPGTRNFHYEMELVVALGGPAFQVEQSQALKTVYGYACGLDMTRRDLQSQAREKSRPWDLGKDVEQSAVLSALVPAIEIGHPSRGHIELKVNGEVRQSADISEMINTVPELIAHLSQFYHLDAGDLIYTGTPAGVGAVVTGDLIEGRIEGIGDIRLTIL